MSTEITSEFVWHNIPPRPRDSHKGSFGTVLVRPCLLPRVRCAPVRAW